MSKTARLLLILSLSVLLIQILPVVTSDLVGPGYWHRFHGDFTNTGISLSPDAPESNRTVWKFETEDPIYSSPAVAEGKLFFGSWDRYLYALDEFTGRELWRFFTDDRIYSSPTYWNGMVYIGTGTEGGSRVAKLYAVNSTTGIEVWSFKAGKNFVGGAIVVDGKVFAGSLDGRLYALDAEGNDDGTTSVFWQFLTGGELWCTPAYYNSSLYITSGDCKLYRIDIETGDEIWSYQSEFSLDGMWGSPSVAEGKVFFGSVFKPLGKIYALDADSGKHLWNYSTGNSRYGVASTPSYYNGSVYVGANNGVMYTLDAKSGSELWNFSTGDDYNGIYSSATYADGKIYFGSSDNFLYCLDAKSGSLIWSFRSGGFGEYGCVSSPVIVEGRLYVGFTGDNALYCFGDFIVPEIELSLEIIPGDESSFRSFVYADENVTLQIRARDSVSGIADSDLILVADMGELELDEGKTDSNGVFRSGYKAPSVSRAKVMELTVKAEAAGYLTEDALFTIEVRLKPALQYSLDGELEPVTAGKAEKICITVKDGTAVADNVTVELRTTEGKLSPITALTDGMGKMCFTYTAPELDENNTSMENTIFIRLIKSGFEAGKYEMKLNIEEDKEEGGSQEEEGVDLVMVGMVITTIILITLIVLGVMIKGKKFW